jgi:uncharacterized protein YceK
MSIRRPEFTVTALFLALPLFTASAPAQSPLTLTYYSFGQSEYGLYPGSGVIAGPAGQLYGTTSESGSFTNCYNGCGTVYEAIPPATADGVWTESALYTFQGAPDGSDPGGLAMDNAGVIYGVTYAGGAGPCTVILFDAGCGTVFSLTPPASPGGSWTEKILYNFTGGTDGGGPQSPMVIGAGGVLYGTAAYGGANSACSSNGVASTGCGTVFSLTPPARPGGTWNFNLLYTFTGFSDGITPENLVMDLSGVLYGNTVYGGSDNCPYGFGYRGCGTIFALTPPASTGGAWTKTVPYAFQGGTDGSRPGGVAIGEVPGGGGSVLYGVTGWGGNVDACGRSDDGCGTAYMLAPPTVPGGSWTETILADFPPGQGYRPSGSLAIGPGGILFGVTAGTENSGFTVYALIPPASSSAAWIKQVLYKFSCCGPGSPSNIMLVGTRLYGTTYEGGVANGGTVWALAP